MRELTIKESIYIVENKLKAARNGGLGTYVKLLVDKKNRLEESLKENKRKADQANGDKAIPKLDVETPDSGSEEDTNRKTDKSAGDKMVNKLDMKSPKGGTGSKTKRKADKSLGESIKQRLREERAKPWKVKAGKRDVYLIARNKKEAQANVNAISKDPKKTAPWETKAMKEDGLYTGFSPAHSKNELRIEEEVIRLGRSILDKQKLGDLEDFFEEIEEEIGARSTDYYEDILEDVFEIWHKHNRINEGFTPRNVREDNARFYMEPTRENIYDFCMYAMRSSLTHLDELIERVEREFGEQVVQKNIDLIEKIWRTIETGVWDSDLAT